jgi:ABC-type branched-subunit amino acid transport system ATPase component
VGQLPYGLQKRVDLGRALAMEPQVLLLDEPMAGMNVEEKQDMCRFILDVNDEFGTTIVLIEHDMGVVMDISDRVVVLDYGWALGDDHQAALSVGISLSTIWVLVWFIAGVIALATGIVWGARAGGVVRA